MEENNGLIQPSNERGVSNTTITVLILLAVVMTVIGTWAVINSINSQQDVHEVYSGGSNVGRVSFTIIPKEKYSGSADGLVILNINN